MAATKTAIGLKTPHHRLVKELAQRFAKPADSTELPLVVVNRISPTAGYHVLVIWDEWEDLNGAERGRVITDAYHQAHPGERVPVTIPLGVTAAEALSMGFLCYRIVPSVRKEDNVTARQINE